MTASRTMARASSRRAERSSAAGPGRVPQPRRQPPPVVRADRPRRREEPHLEGQRAAPSGRPQLGERIEIQHGRENAGSGEGHDRGNRQRREPAHELADARVATRMTHETERNRNHHRQRPDPQSRTDPMDCLRDPGHVGPEARRVAGQGKGHPGAGRRARGHPPADARPPCPTARGHGGDTREAGLRPPPRPPPAVDGDHPHQLCRDGLVETEDGPGLRVQARRRAEDEEDRRAADDDHERPFGHTATRIAEERGRQQPAAGYRAGEPEQAQVGDPLPRRQQDERERFAFHEPACRTQALWYRCHFGDVPTLAGHRPVAELPD